MLARGVLRPELFALAALVVGDDGVRRVQNRLCRAVVLLKADDLRAAVLRLKAQNILNRRAAEFIDALVVVAHNADIFIPTREQRRELILQLVGILILVNEHIVEFALIERTHLFV